MKPFAALFCAAVIAVLAVLAASPFASAASWMGQENAWYGGSYSAGSSSVAGAYSESHYSDGSSSRSWNHYSVTATYPSGSSSASRQSFGFAAFG